VVQGWHRSGWLIGTEKNGILPPSPSAELPTKFQGGRGWMPRSPRTDREGRATA
jgi:hypothetical protein